MRAYLCSNKLGDGVTKGLLSSGGCQKVTQVEHLIVKLHQRAGGLLERTLPQPRYPLPLLGMEVIISASRVLA